MLYAKDETMLAEGSRSSERSQYMVFGVELVKVKRREGVSDSLCSATRSLVFYLRDQ